MRTMIVGDTHGNERWLREYIYPTAMTVQADAIVVLGDFGAWEHTTDGVHFMDKVGALSQRTNIPLYWLHGNHDKHSHTLATYQRDSRGFVACREFLFYIPQGHAWTWAGVDLRSFGGAWSVDKAWRVQREQEKYLSLLRKERYRKQSTGVTSLVKPQDGTLWFPEEEMTDAEMSQLLADDSGRKHIVLSHDKPFSAKLPWNRKDFPGCMPNQLRLEIALRAHKPDWWLHGHLHYHYQDKVFGSDFLTTIVGLEPDDNAGEPGWKARHTWALADLDAGTVQMKMGSDTFVDAEALRENTLRLS